MCDRAALKVQTAPLPKFLTDEQSPGQHFKPKPDILNKTTHLALTRNNIQDGPHAVTAPITVNSLLPHEPHVKVNHQFQRQSPELH